MCIGAPRLFACGDRAVTVAIVKNLQTTLLEQFSFTGAAHRIVTVLPGLILEF